MAERTYCDTKLVTLLRSGDRRSFETIYLRYANTLFQYACRNISLKEDCEEIIQDVFVSLWSRREAIPPAVVIRAYLFSMVRYNIIRYMQRSHSRRRYEDHYKLFEAVYDTQPESENKSETIQQVIEKGLSTLPSRCSAAVKLRLHENLSNAEIAVRMNINKSTVENYMVAAVKQLRQLAKEGVLPASIYFEK